MLVIVSDLHLCDGTASPANVSPDAFALLLDEVYGLARDYQAKDLDICFLGDVFDLLRSERWFEAAGRPVPVAERPWGSAAALTEPRASTSALGHAHAIADGILAANQAALRALRGEGRADQPPCPVRRVYLSGNHDRLMLHDPTLHAKLLGALGALDPSTLASDGIYPHALEMARYGLLARHGHEWDGWNFERLREDATAADYQDDDYLYTPIGDPITTELIARLPYELRKRLDATPAFHGTPELARVIASIQRIEDVRPLVASFRWVWSEATRLHETLPEPQARALAVALSDTARAIATDFERLEYFQAWKARHHKILRFDRAEKLDLILSFVRAVDLSTVSDLASRFPSLFDSPAERGPLRIGAARENLDGMPEGARFVVYGHSHEHVLAMLHPAPAQTVYLNSGTWRKREFLTDDGQGFAGCELFTYLAFADRHETHDASDRGEPAFIAWNGARRV